MGRIIRRGTFSSGVRKTIDKAMAAKPKKMRRKLRQRLPARVSFDGFRRKARNRQEKIGVGN